MAVKTPCQPSGRNPWEVKFSPWNDVSRKAMTTSVMMASFHHTRMLLTLANHRTPR